MIRIVGKRGKGSFESQLDDAAKGKEFVVVDCTSGNKDMEMVRGLSPFYLGPVETYDGLVSETFERAWQCAKVYPWMVDSANNPDSRYFAWRDEMWAKKGFESKLDIRFPAGKGNARKCLYAWWKVDGEFKKLGYVEGRKYIYLPLYARAVVKTDAYRRLCEMRDAGKNLMLLDFDGYNPFHSRYNFTYNDVVHCPLLKMGHGFVLAMLLEGLIKVDEKGIITYAEGLMNRPNKMYSPDLRKLTEDQKLERGASQAGVSLEEWKTLSPSERTLLRVAAKKENVYARGFTKAAWKRLSMREKFDILRNVQCKEG
jgi:hypothetical protein